MPTLITLATGVNFGPVRHAVLIMGLKLLEVGVVLFGIALLLRLLGFGGNDGPSEGSSKIREGHEFVYHEGQWDQVETPLEVEGEGRHYWTVDEWKEFGDSGNYQRKAERGEFW